jgi:hypothetical protein
MKTLDTVDFYVAGLVFSIVLFLLSCDILLIKFLLENPIDVNVLLVGPVILIILFLSGLLFSFIKEEVLGL